jgi:hypothetical protein
VFSYLKRINIISTFVESRAFCLGQGWRILISDYARGSILPLFLLFLLFLVILFKKLHLSLGFLSHQSDLAHTSCFLRALAVQSEVRVSRGFFFPSDILLRPFGFTASLDICSRIYELGRGVAQKGADRDNRKHRFIW